MILTLIVSLIIFHSVMVWEQIDNNGLEEFVDAFYGRLKEILKGDF